MQSNSGPLALFDQLLVSGGGFFTIAICAHFLSPEQQGRLGYVLAAYVFAVIINIPVVFQRAAVLAPARSEPDSYLLALTHVQLGIAAGVSIAATAILTFAPIREVWYPSGEEVALMGGFLFSQQISDFVRRSAYIFDTRINAAASSASVYPVRVLLLVLVGPSTLTDALWILLLSNSIPVVVFASGWTRLLMAQARGSSAALVGAHLKGSWAFLGTGVFSWLWNYLPLFLLGHLTGMSAVAVLFSVRSLANLANLFLEFLETRPAAYIGKLAATGFSDGVDRYVSRVSRLALLLWLTLLVVFVTLGKPLISLVLSAKYEAYSHILTISWLLMGVLFLLRVRSIVHRSFERSVSVLWGAVSGAATVALFGPIMIAESGVTGAALTLLLGALANLVAQEVHARRVQK